MKQEQKSRANGWAASKNPCVSPCLLATCVRFQRKKRRVSNRR